MKKYFLASLGIIAFMACGGLKTDSSESTADSNPSIVHEGEILLRKNCYVCHSPTLETGRIAPPMQYVKQHYIKDGTTQEEFTKAFLSFIKQPSKGKAKMPGAIANFGLMPQQEFPEATLLKIADYLYNNDIEGPEDFKKHKKKHGNSQSNNQKSSGMSKAERGLKYALDTKSVLGKNLMGKIQSEGTISALQFCSTKAIHLTDSLSKVHHALISRITDKPRNQANMATEDELSHLRFFKKLISEGQEPESIISEENGKTYFYYPILTNSMCMQCHGKPNIDIENSTLAAIKANYPEDKATGYSVNEVRGMWKVVFDE